MTRDGVLARIMPVTESGCWLWIGGLTSKGYGQTGRGDRGRAHRVLYQALRGDVGDLTLDHLCRVRCCVNPDHLEPVTSKINTLRGVGPTAQHARATHCKRGHPLPGPDKRGYRICRPCWAITRRASYKRARIARAAQTGEPA